MHLSQVVSVEALSAAVTDGMVRVQGHPSLPLRIFNYTEQAVYSRNWNEATTVGRGLIVDDGDIVRARPWPKFFNHGEMAGTVRRRVSRRVFWRARW
jgi:RNA ligase